MPLLKYLSVRFPANRFPAELAGLIHERTEGNPLFMVNAVDYLVAEGLIGEHERSWELVVEIEKVEVGVPDSIKQMIEKQVDHLDAERAANTRGGKRGGSGVFDARGGGWIGRGSSAGRSAVR